MRTKYRSREEQMHLILECRTSGLSDYQWCEQNGINKSSFYNWVNRLRKAGYQFPDSKSKKNSLPLKQEVVKVEVRSTELEASSIIEMQNAPISNSLTTQSDTLPAVEIQMAVTTIRFFNNTNPDLLKCTLECLGGATRGW